MPGTLYVVATPIGNLEDITLRALRVLREVSLIAAEDTRRTAKLLTHYSISTPTTSVHEHNERRRVEEILNRLRGGGDVALVSDAGTPTVSDPGSHLVGAALAAGLKVVPIPGPSAVLSALASSGYSTDSFVFAGFAPRRSKARKEWLQALHAESRTVLFFEAPHRIRETLTEAAAIFGKRPIMVARELTKVHEELVKGPISDILPRFKEPRGEFTVVVAPASAVPESPAERDFDKEVPGHEVLAEFGRLTETEGLSRRQAVARLAGKYALPQRRIYSAIEMAKRSVG